MKKYKYFKSIEFQFLSLFILAAIILFIIGNFARCTAIDEESNQYDYSSCITEME